MAPLSSSQSTAQKYHYIQTEPNDELIEAIDNNFPSLEDEALISDSRKPIKPFNQDDEDTAFYDSA